MSFLKMTHSQLPTNGPFAVSGLPVSRALINFRGNICYVCLQHGAAKQCRHLLPLLNIISGSHLAPRQSAHQENHYPLPPPSMSPIFHFCLPHHLTCSVLNQGAGNVLPPRILLARKSAKALGIHKNHRQSHHSPPICTKSHPFPIQLTLHPSHGRTDVFTNHVKISL
jgi:hypothetical protein